MYYDVFLLKNCIGYYPYMYHSLSLGTAAPLCHWLRTCHTIRFSLFSLLLPWYMGFPMRICDVLYIFLVHGTSWFVTLSNFLSLSLSLSLSQSNVKAKQQSKQVVYGVWCVLYILTIHMMHTHTHTHIHTYTHTHTSIHFTLNMTSWHYHSSTWDFAWCATFLLISTPLDNHSLDRYPTYLLPC